MYFFFQGENIEKFGSDISSNNGVKKNTQFVSAVQGMLGFNWLYTEQADLKKLATIYRNETLIEYHIKNYQEQTISDLMDFLSLTYGIVIEKADIIEALKKANYSYDSDTGIIRNVHDLSVDDNDDLTE